MKLDLKDWVPSHLTREYHPDRYANPNKPPTRQDVGYYRRVGWCRTRRGKKIHKKGGVWQISNGITKFSPGECDPEYGFPGDASHSTPIRYRVPSQVSDRHYKVDWTGHSTSSSCTCKDFHWGQVCKHVRTVRRWREEMKKAQPHAVGEDEVLDQTFSEEEDKVHNEAEELEAKALAIQWGPD